MVMYQSSRSRGGSRSRGRGRGRSRYHHNDNRTMNRPNQRGFHSQKNQMPASQHSNAGTLKNAILEILEKSYPRPMLFHNLHKLLPIAYTKSQANHILYDLEKSGDVKRTSQQPPYWVLVKRTLTNCNALNVTEKRESDAKPGSSSSTCSIPGFTNSSQVSSLTSGQEWLKSEDCDDDMEYADMPPLTDGGSVSSACNNIHYMGGASRPSISVAPPSHYKDGGNQPNQFTWNNAGSLKDQLLQFLCTSQSYSISDILTKFKDHKKHEINHALYSLQEEGLAFRSKEDPPIWQLTNKSVVGRRESNTSTSVSSIHGSDFSSKRQSPSDYASQMESVSISRVPDTTRPPPPKIPRLTTHNKFKDGLGKSDKNPISQLMEYAQARGLKTDFATTSYGPPHKMKFRVVATVGAEAFPPVEGSSKKEAKTLACELVLSMLEQTALMSASTEPAFTPVTNQVKMHCLHSWLSCSVARSYNYERPTLLRLITSTRFIAVRLEVYSECCHPKDSDTLFAAFPTWRTAPAEAENKLPVLISAGNSSKNAISLVNEYAQANSLKIEFNCNSFGPDHRKSFRTILTIGKQTFHPVEAGSKKDSKLKAAEAGLLILQEAGKIRNSVAAESGGRIEMKTFHDRVANMVNEKFHSLLAELPDTVVGRKILAGFVMSQTIKTDAGEETQWSVISIGSGNRCVAGDQLSMKGDTVNDCHAEIIARRGLVRYLYDQIESFNADPNDEDNILQTSSQNPSKLEIKSGIHFHLYISTAPCGDSALFAKSDLGDDVAIDLSSNQHHPLFENKKQGILRTKVENGEGCIPIDQDANVPTWDGLLRGERLRTMSCSDKLAKWNYVGLQGALLSHFLMPIYMSSLTLGMLFHHGHLTRAVCCRVDKYVTEFAPEHDSTLFKPNHPQVAKISGDDPSRDTGKMKTREYSLNWSFGDERAEVLDGTKGRCEARYGCINPVSQVSKSSLYAKFKEVSKISYPSYFKAKEAATEYKAATAALKIAFEKAECGTWMSKPEEVEEF